MKVLKILRFNGRIRSASELAVDIMMRIHNLFPNVEFVHKYSDVTKRLYALNAMREKLMAKAAKTSQYNSGSN